eukprot:13032695-Heterocapsa_arctica.AAC.1
MCFQETGNTPIPLKWADTNKGDTARPNYRSRIVAKEIKAYKSKGEKIPFEQLFSSIPPLEAIMGLISLLISWSRGQSSAGGSVQSTGGSAQG